MDKCKCEDKNTDYHLLNCCNTGKELNVVSVEDIADIIHRGIYEKPLSEEHPVRNLHIYAISRMIHNKIYDKAGGK